MRHHEMWIAKEDYLECDAVTRDTLMFYDLNSNTRPLELREDVRWIHKSTSFYVRGYFLSRDRAVHGFVFHSPSGRPAYYLIRQDKTGRDHEQLVARDYLKCLLST